MSYLMPAQGSCDEGAISIESYSEFPTKVEMNSLSSVSWSSERMGCFDEASSEFSFAIFGTNRSLGICDTEY